SLSDSDDELEFELPPHLRHRSPPDSDGEFDDSAEQILFDQLKHLPQDL
ncbi:2968_t:CDS:2, partial [Funneliformis mosseae]